VAKPRDVTVRLPRIDEIVPPLARKALLQQLGLLQIGRIKRRTKDGVDVNGNPFAPYSPRYAEQRKRAGWSTKPDLWLRGGMLGGLAVVDVDESRVLVGFQGTAQRTRFTAMTRLRRGGHFVGMQRVRASKTDKKTGGRIDLVVTEANGRIPNALKAFYNQKGRKPRRFFGLSAEDRVFLAKHALRELLKIVGQVTLGRAARRG
jgi:hypothetical protein